MLKEAMDMQGPLCPETGLHLHTFTNMILCSLLHCCICTTCVCTCICICLCVVHVQMCVSVCTCCYAVVGACVCAKGVCICMLMWKMNKCMCNSIFRFVCSISAYFVTCGITWMPGSGCSAGSQGLCFAPSGLRRSPWPIRSQMACKSAFDFKSR